jgi:hypothetical protein
MRSTIQAVCCGTKRTTVLVGSRGLWKYVGRGPPDEEPKLETGADEPGRRAAGEDARSRADGTSVCGRMTAATAERLDRRAVALVREATMGSDANSS